MSINAAYLRDQAVKALMRDQAMTKTEAVKAVEVVFPYGGEAAMYAFYRGYEHANPNDRVSVYSLRNDIQTMRDILRKMQS